MCYNLPGRDASRRRAIFCAEAWSLAPRPGTSDSIIPQRGKHRKGIVNVERQSLRNLVPIAACSFATAIFLASFAPPFAHGQTTELAFTPPAATADATAIAPAAERDAEYAAIASQYQSLESELGLVKRVVKLVTPSVVHIEARVRPRGEDVRQVEEAGSGVIVEFDRRPYVLTARHVVRRSTPDRIEIHLADGRVLRPQRIWSDDRTDVGVLSLEANDVPAVRIGNSDTLEIGDHVLAIGSPFGLMQSVTRGIVSAKGRHNLNLGEGDRLLQDFIQTDAAINPGNSGGPLVNLRGEVVGLNTAIASASGGNEGVGFSIPINVADRVARALVSGHQIPRGYLGVNLDRNFDDEQAQALGMPRAVGTRITFVRQQSPAEAGRLKVDDIILEYNGVRIDHDAHLVSMVKLTEVGQQVEVLVLRQGQPVRLMVKIGDERDFDVSPSSPPAPAPSSPVQRPATRGGNR
jgi:serine protease Do